MSARQGGSKTLRLKPLWQVIVVVCGMVATTSMPYSQEGQSAPKPPAAKPAAKANALPQLWKSTSTGREYRVKIDGDRFTAEWSNIPVLAAKQGAYIRSECRRSGARWVGTSHILLPCAPPDGKMKMCPMTLRFEVDHISPDRITGGGEILRDFDCGSCEVRKTGWGPFSWTPKSSDK
jgi:hypothetical protein